MMPSLPASWVFFPHFILRSTGFPVQMLQRIQNPKTVERLSECAKQRTVVEGLRQEYLRLFDAWIDMIQAAHPKGDPVFASAYAARRAVVAGNPVPPELRQILPECPLLSPGWPDRWSEALSELAIRQERALAAFETEVPAARLALKEFAEMPRFARALFVSNPEMFRTALPYLNRHWNCRERPAKVKHVERRLVSYLQRFTAKNDTQSFFGPLQYGRRKRADVPFHFRHVPEQSVSRGFFAYWAVRVLAERAASEPAIRQHLPYSRPADLTVTENGLLTSLSTGRSVALPPELVPLVAVADGSRSAAAIARCIGRDPDWVNARLELLERKGVFHRRFVIPVASTEPLAALRDQMADLPAGKERDYWLGILERCMALCREWDKQDQSALSESLSTLEAEFTAWTGVDPRRAGGEMYADRTLLHQECRGPVCNLHISEAMFDEIAARLAPVLDVAAAYGALRRLDYRQMAARLYAQLSPDGSPVPLARFLYEWGRASWEEPPRAAAFHTALRELVARKAASVAQSAGEPWVVHFATEEWPQPDPDLLRQRTLMTSPDLMIAASDPEAIAAGNWRLVVGEVHWGLQLFSNLLTMHPAPQEVASDLPGFIESLPHYGELANLIPAKRFGKMFYQEIFPASVTLSGHSTLPPEQVLPLSEVWVQRVGSELLLTSPARQAPLTLYVGDADNPLSFIFAEPVVVLPDLSLGAHTPRIEVGGVVVQRERWDVEADSVPRPAPKTPPFEAYRNLLLWREQLGLPPQVYLKATTEVKPFFIDFTSYLSVELFWHIVSRGGKLKFTEPLPDFEQLWLKDNSGSYCSEMRMSCYRRPLVFQPKWKESTP